MERQMALFNRIDTVELGTYLYRKRPDSETEDRVTAFLVAVTEMRDAEEAARDPVALPPERAIAMLQEVARRLVDVTGP